MFRLLIIMLLLLSISTAISSQPRMALVIGNTAYDGQIFSKLSNPGNDAQDMKEALAALGFEVQLALNCSKGKMETAMVELRRKLVEKKGVALFYYAGHGIQIGGKNYLIPVGSDIKSRGEVATLAVSVEKVLENMQAATLKIVILDACRNNPFPEEPSVDGQKREGKKNRNGLANMDAARGTVIAFATEPGKGANDNNKNGERNGMFTKHLLQHIQEANIDIGRMLRQVRKAVAQATNNEQIPTHRESLFDDFYFKRGNDRYEPNDSRDQAKAVVAGSYRELRIEKGDHDWFVTDKAGDEELQVRIEFQHRVGDLDMKVYGPKETKKANSSNDNEEVKLTGPTGSYRIEVYGYENAVNEYDLHIVRGQLSPPSPPPPSPPSPPPSYGLPEVVWQQCRYRHNGQWLLDMTGDYWSRLSVSEQQRYATQYQRGYAAKLGKPVAQSFSSGGTTVVMRLIPPGRFWMGSPDNEKGRDSDESPRHRVVLSWGYWLAETEVTQQQWRQVMKDKDKDSPSYFSKAGANAPVEQVSWERCQEFCKKTGWRLPTEAEWEYACRSGTVVSFYWGEQWDRRQLNSASYWAKEDLWDSGEWQQKFWSKWQKLGATTTNVKTFAANAWGLYDMLGNVWEWCQDWKGDYAASEQIYPTGPATGSSRVCRGGSWSLNARYCRSANRNSDEPGNRDGGLGLRPARSF